MTRYTVITLRLTSSHYEGQGIQEHWLTAYTGPDKAVADRVHARERALGYEAHVIVRPGAKS